MLCLLRIPVNWQLLFVQVQIEHSHPTTAASVGTRMNEIVPGNPS